MAVLLAQNGAGDVEEPRRSEYRSIGWFGVSLERLSATCAMRPLSRRTHPGSLPAAEPRRRPSARAGSADASLGAIDVHANDAYAGSGVALHTVVETPAYVRAARGVPSDALRIRITVFAKNETSNLSVGERAALISTARELAVACRRDP